MTKAQRIWRDKYERVRSVFPAEEAIRRANSAVEEELAVVLSYSEADSMAQARVRLPNGHELQEHCVGYLTTTIKLRLTEILLSKLKMSDVAEK